MYIWDEGADPQSSIRMKVGVGGFFSLPNKDEFLSLGVLVSSRLGKRPTPLAQSFQAPPRPPRVSGSALCHAPPLLLRASSHFRFRCGTRASAAVAGGDGPVSADGGPRSPGLWVASAQLRPCLGPSPGCCEPPFGCGPEGRPPRTSYGLRGLRPRPCPRRGPELAGFDPATGHRSRPLVKKAARTLRRRPGPGVISKPPGFVPVHEPWP